MQATECKTLSRVFCIYYMRKVKAPGKAERTDKEMVSEKQGECPGSARAHGLWSWQTWF